MASKIKVDQIEGSTGTSVTIPTGHSFTVTDGMSVAGGGTGLTSFTAGDVLYATGSTTLAKLPKGTAEQVLAMNSGATAPDWGSVDLTVLPTITVAKGGTNLSSFAAGDILYATGSTTLAKLAKGTGLQGLQTNSGATAPEWAASPQSVLTTAGDTLYASSSNTMARLAKGTASQVLTMNSGATAPEWAAAGGGGKVLSITKKRTANNGTYHVSSTIKSCGSSYSLDMTYTSGSMLHIMLNGHFQTNSYGHSNTTHAAHSGLYVYKTTGSVPAENAAIGGSDTLVHYTEYGNLNMFDVANKNFGWQGNMSLAFYDTPSGTACKYYLGQRSRSTTTIEIYGSPTAPFFMTAIEYDIS